MHQTSRQMQGHIKVGHGYVTTRVLLEVQSAVSGCVRLKTAVCIQYVYM
jgi:hypothetical protein